MKQRSQNKLSKKLLKNTFVMQHDQSDCGVACLLSLIQYYQGSSSIEKLRELSGTTKQGTTLLGLYQAANSLGFDAQGNEANIEELIDYDTPLILHILIGGQLQHYLICYGFESEKFVIGDPGKGIMYYTKSELESVWKSKTCLTLVPNKRFKKSSDIKAHKKQWFLSLLKEDYKLLLFSVLLGVSIAILGMTMAVFSQKMIDDILPSKDFNKLITGIILITALLLVKVFFGTLRSYFLIRQTKDFNNRIIDGFYSALLHLPKPFFDSRKIGELVARLNDTQRVQRVINLIAGSVIIDALVTITSLGFLFYYSLITGILALLILPFYFLLIYSFNTSIKFAQKELMRSYALSESNYITSIQGIATIKNNNRQSIFKKMNQFIYGNYQNNRFKLGNINIRLSVFSGVFGVLFLTGILTYASIQVYNGTMQLGELMAILGISGSLLPSVASLAIITIPINEAKIAFNRMYEFASIESEQNGNIAITDFNSLKIEGLSFRFAGRSQLLKNINLELRKNECIAIVGESGCGKSTLGQIIQKFYVLESGRIRVNGNLEITELKTKDWRNILGVIPQDITIFNGNLIDNVLLGKVDRPERVMKFCETYGFQKFISELPQGYNTIMGEGGVNLSGGQKQLLALIRVLYKRPKLLILDEFTSAMDRRTEHFVISLLNNLKSEMSIIFISHRLHSLKKIADKIYVIENGVSVVSGNHHELMESQNFYSEFWNLLLEA